MSRRNPLRLALPWAVPGIAMLLTQSVSAGGFALIEQGASGMGNAYAGAAAVGHDASTVWFNPAGMMELQDPQLIVAGHLVSVNSNFTNQSTSLNTVFGATPVEGDGNLGVGGMTGLPNLYYVREIKDDLSFGVGVSVPFGNSSDYGREWVGRYQAAESAVSVLDINPSIAYRVNPKLSIGGGISVQVFEVTLRSAVDSGATCLGLQANPDNPVQLADCANAGLTTPGDISRDGYADISGDSVGATVNLGLLYKPDAQTRLGLAFRSPVRHEVDGDVDFTTDEALANVLSTRGVPLLVDGGVSSDAGLPGTLMGSVAHQASDKLELLADITFTDWSRVDELRVKFDNPAQPDSVTTLAFNDVWRVSAGLNYALSDQLTLRAGVAYDKDPVPSVEFRTASIPGNDRTWVAMGLGFNVNKNINFDVGYARLFLDDTPLDNAAENAGGTTTRGVFQSSANLFSAQLNYKFN